MRKQRRQADVELPSPVSSESQSPHSESQKCDTCKEISFEDRAIAVSMGLIPRLGTNSVLKLLSDELVWKIMKDNFARPLQISENLALKGDYVAELQRWIGASLAAEGQVLYLATRDGWSGLEFHQRCDGKGETISLVFCKTGHIFGGFASRPWSCSGLEHSDPRAFVFSLCAGSSDPPRQPVQCRQSGHAPEYAVYHGRYTFCPCFGYALALDLSRPDRCRSDFNQGAIYRRPHDPHGSVTDLTFLAGRSEGWDIEEVAVILVAAAEHLPADPAAAAAAASEPAGPEPLSSPGSASPPLSDLD
jgi:hypothetical protein